jgi:hypothetical protein
LEVEFELDVELEACVCSGAEMMSFAFRLKTFEDLKHSPPMGIDKRDT